MDNFFDTVNHRWPAGRTDYHWHILPPPDDTRSALVEPYRELTHRDGLAPVPAEWLHLTVLHSAPVNEITDDELEQITDGVRRECASIAPFAMTLERPHVGRVAIECAGRPGAPARRLWQVTADATRDVIGDRVPVTPALYHPHVSLAYGVASSPNAPMKVWLSDNGPGTFTFRVTRLTLVAQSHDGTHITWRHVHDVPLADA